MNRRAAEPLQQPTPGTAEFAEAMLQALASRPRSIAPKFFYDETGIALFERICTLDEYYLTRAETSILRAHASAIAQLAGERAELIEFGAGSPGKARILLDAMIAPARYVPIDISISHLREASPVLQRDYPGLSVEPLAADFSQPLALPAGRAGAGRRLALFLGSTIGNLSGEDTRRFLAGAARQLPGGALLVGVDLVKDPAVLHRAYNDSEGITAAFNRNLLVRANRELGADFEADSFQHYAFYAPRAQRIEMHLVSSRRQSVHVCGHTFVFEQGESLHTESSHKYTIEGFGELARRAGFTPGPVWCDPARQFSVHWLAVPHGARRADAAL
jgi:dimethylhistidine N-methyltransferase